MVAFTRAKENCIMGTKNYRHEHRGFAMGSVDAHQETHAEHEHSHEHSHEEPMSPADAVRSLLLLGQVALDAGDYESATEAFASILQIEQNEVALYNLGSFYARGLGVRQSFAEAARLFHQAELLGNARAGKLCAKCMFDYIHNGFVNKAPVEIYAAMAVFVSCVYPEVADQRREVNNGLLAVGGTYLHKGDRDAAIRVFRAAVEFGDDEYAQTYLSEL